MRKGATNGAERGHRLVAPRELSASARGTNERSNASHQPPLAPDLRSAAALASLFAFLRRKAASCSPCGSLYLNDGSQRSAQCSTTDVLSGAPQAQSRPPAQPFHRLTS